MKAAYRISPEYIELFRFFYSLEEKRYMNAGNST
jgi:hypothetical protein